MKTVDDYIAAIQDTHARSSIVELRQLVKQIVPEAVESIAYGMPAYKLNGKPLIYFAAFAKHIGVYALPGTHAAFAEELSRYKQGKGSIQFPLDQPVPFAVIEKMIAHNAGHIRGGA